MQIENQWHTHTHSQNPFTNNRNSISSFECLSIWNRFGFCVFFLLSAWLQFSSGQITLHLAVAAWIDCHCVCLCVLVCIVYIYLMRFSMFSPKNLINLELFFFFDSKTCFYWRLNHLFCVPCPEWDQSFVFSVCVLNLVWFGVCMCFFSIFIMYILFFAFTARLNRWIWRWWFDPGAVWSSHMSPIRWKFR